MFHGMDGGGFMWFGMIFWLILLVAIIWAVVATVSRNKNTNSNEPETPMEILKKRYAKGEITKEQFEEMKKNIL